ncbi:MAG: Gfo/Idh/MocA family oxidoreductase, partial [Deinococcus sp.]|nr:Gfo/Idh/MocA family oxidoreductase [Deinococcus sp.]
MAKSKAAGGKLGAGIVGLGWVAGEYIKGFAHRGDTEVVTLCSRDLSKAKAVAKQHGLENCTAYDDYEKMLEDERVGLVAICTPHPQHAPQTIAAAQAGKHIIIEKPVAINLKDLKAMRDAVRKAKVKTVVSFVLRWNPLFETVKRLLAEKSLGDLYYGEVDYLHGIGPWYGQYSWNIKKDMGGSALLTAGCHAVDGLRWFIEKRGCGGALKPSGFSPGI